MSVRELVDERVIGGEYVFGHPNCEGERCEEGDVFVLARGCGGGYGDVLERDAEAVLADVQDGVFSREAARDTFGVVIDERGDRVDTEATVRQRDALRTERLRRGRPYDEFVAEWSTRRPPDEALRYYGEYPVPRQLVALDPTRTSGR
jgi:acetophenone carboxylase